MLFFVLFILLTVVNDDFISFDFVFIVSFICVFIVLIEFVTVVKLVLTVLILSIICI